MEEEKFSNDDVYNKFLFKSPKKTKKFKESSPFKKNFDYNINTTENSSIINAQKQSKLKILPFSTKFQNILFKYLAFSPKNNPKKFRGTILNSNISTIYQSNSLIQNIQYTPHFNQLKNIDLGCNKKCLTPNKKDKTKKHHHNFIFTSLHKQIKSDYKEILKNHIEKPIKMNIVSRKFKIPDDFNEIHSKIFLYEKDKCLKKMHLTDEIEEEKENCDKIELTLSPINHDSYTNSFSEDVKEKRSKKLFSIQNLDESEKYLTNFLISVK